MAITGGFKGVINVIKQKNVFIILIGLLIVCAMIGTIFIIRLVLFDSTSDEEVIKSFKDNKSFFEDAKSYILEERSIDEIYEDSYDKNQKSLEQIFSTLKYRGIHKTDKGAFVYFVRVSELGFTQGIVFSATGNEPSGSYITKTIIIEDGWFLYKSK